MSIQRLNKNDNSSSLYFWEELKLFDYHLNTRVENIHAGEVKGIISFYSLQQNLQGFV